MQSENLQFPDEVFPDNVLQSLSAVCPSGEYGSSLNDNFPANYLSRLSFVQSRVIQLRGLA